MAFFFLIQTDSIDWSLILDDSAEAFRPEDLPRDLANQQMNQLQQLQLDGQLQEDHKDDVFPFPGPPNLF